jgi:hypothetical protein
MPARSLASLALRVPHILGTASLAVRAGAAPGIIRKGQGKPALDGEQVSI